MIAISLRIAVVQADARVREAGRVRRLVVLPEPPPAKDIELAPLVPPPAPREERASLPDAGAAPETRKPAEVRELSGRISFKNLGPFAKHLVLTNTDTLIWSGCILVIRGRDVYKLGGIAPGGTREMPWE